MSRYDAKDTSDPLNEANEPDANYGWTTLNEEVHDQGNRIDKALSELEDRLKPILNQDDMVEKRAPRSEEPRCQVINDMGTIIARLQQFGDRITNLRMRVDI